MNSSNGGTIFFIVILSTTFVALFMPILLPKLRNLGAPVLTVRAEIVSMSSRIYKRRRGQKAPFGIVTFETADREYPEVLVNEAQFNELELGAHGMLTYKGNKFLGFERED